jgi:hypothetical protein
MSITIATLETCIEEAERFLVRAEEALKVHKDEVVLYKGADKHTYGDGPKNAAVRRSSMDLSRSLAELRRWRG